MKSLRIRKEKPVGNLIILSKSDCSIMVIQKLNPFNCMNLH